MAIVIGPGFTTLEGGCRRTPDAERGRHPMFHGTALHQSLTAAAQSPDNSPDSVAEYLTKFFQWDQQGSGECTGFMASSLTQWARYKTGAGVQQLWPPYNYWWSRYPYNALDNGSFIPNALEAAKVHGIRSYISDAQLLYALSNWTVPPTAADEADAALYRGLDYYVLAWDGSLLDEELLRLALNAQHGVGCGAGNHAFTLYAYRGPRGSAIYRGINSHGVDGHVDIASADLHTLFDICVTDSGTVALPPPPTNIETALAELQAARDLLTQ